MALLKSATHSMQILYPTKFIFQIIKDYHLFGILLFLLVVDCIILLIWTLMHSLQKESTVTKRKVLFLRCIMGNGYHTTSGNKLSASRFQHLLTCGSFPFFFKSNSLQDRLFLFKAYTFPLRQKENESKIVILIFSQNKKTRIRLRHSKNY